MKVAQYYGNWQLTHFVSSRYKTEIIIIATIEPILLIHSLIIYYMATIMCYCGGDWKKSNLTYPNVT